MVMTRQNRHLHIGISTGRINATIGALIASALCLLTALNLLLIYP